eukprot:g8210.t1
MSSRTGRRRQRQKRVAMEELSLQDLKSRLYGTLQRTGVMDQVKAQIRSQVVGQLQRAYEHASTGGIAGGAAGVAAGTSSPAACPTPPSLHTRVLHSLVFEHLRATRCAHTLSVFAAESGLGRGGSAQPLEAPDILKILHIDDGSALSGRLTRISATAQAAEDEGGLPVDVPGADADESASLLARLLHELGALASVRARRAQGLASSAATQTDEEALTHGHRGHRELLEAKLRRISQAYEQRNARAAQAGPDGVEARMRAFCAEVEERSRKEVAAAREAFREQELAAARATALEQAREEHDAVRRRLDAEHAARVAALQQREERSQAELARRRTEADAELYEARQALLRGAEAARARAELARAEARHSARAQAEEAKRLHAQRASVEGREREVEGMEARLRRQAESKLDAWKRDARAEWAARAERVEAAEDALATRRAALDAEVAAQRAELQRHEAAVRALAELGDERDKLKA